MYEHRVHPKLAILEEGYKIEVGLHMGDNDRKNWDDK